MKSILHQAIHPQVRTIDGLSIRFAESEPREHHALLLCPWPESLYAYEAAWHRLDTLPPLTVSTSQLLAHYGIGPYKDYPEVLTK